MKVTERKNGHVQFIIGTKIIKKQSKSSRYFYTEEEAALEYNRLADIYLIQMIS